MLERELALRAELDSAWAVRPLALAQHQGRPALILEDQQGELLDRVATKTPSAAVPWYRVHQPNRR